VQLLKRININFKHLIFKYLVFKHLTLFVFFVFCLGSCKPVIIGKDKKAIKGILDLKHQPFDDAHIIHLKGEWAFYWHQLLTPTHFFASKQPQVTRFVEIPQVWNNYSPNFPAEGYATYKLKILLPSHAPALYLKTLTFSTASTIYINGLKVSTSGEVGESAWSMQPAYKPQVIELPENVNQLDVIIQVSNFYYSKGGMWDSIVIGKKEAIKSYHKRNLVFHIFLVGSILVMAFYSFIIYFIGKNDITPLFWGLFCSLVALRALVTNEYLLLKIFPIDWFWLVRLEYLSYYLAALFFTLFAYFSFKALFPKKLMQFIVFYVGVFVSMVIFTPTRFYTSFINYFHLITVLCSIYFTYMLIRLIIEKRKNAILFLCGWLGLFMTFINDILFGNHLIDTGNYAHLGLFFLLLCYSYILSKNFTETFKRIDFLNVNLQKTNFNLTKTVEERTLQLQKAFEELQSSHRNINLKLKNLNSSLVYAKRIQKAILPKLETIQMHLPHTFVLYKPRETVSGDFYWFGAKHGKQILIVADCTGHGVPGAFLSMMGNDLLNEIIIYDAITSPDEILYHLHQRMRKSLTKTGDKNYDGMDLAILTIDSKAKKVEYAGAHNPVYLIQNQTFQQIRGDKKSVGVTVIEYKTDTFTKHTIHIHQPTTLYIFSDGFQDQFGGQHGRKFGSSRFKEVLLQNHEFTMNTQMDLLNQTMNDWMNEGETHEQIDDILVVGLQIG
jgi:serine phosphatase RsbU (regulator of sigma subunit)